MQTIPKAALYLGLGGLLPFLWGALTFVNGNLALWTITTIGPHFVGPFVQLFYGTIILSLMSGVLWGFSCKELGHRRLLDIFCLCFQAFGFSLQRVAVQ